MPTYIFRNRQTGATDAATSHALNPARDILAARHPGGWDATVWARWECWDGGRCIWHYDETGEIFSGPRE